MIKIVILKTYCQTLTSQTANDSSMVVPFTATTLCRIFTGNHNVRCINRVSTHRHHHCRRRRRIFCIKFVRNSGGTTDFWKFRGAKNSKEFPNYNENSLRQIRTYKIPPRNVVWTLLFEHRLQPAPVYVFTEADTSLPSLGQKLIVFNNVTIIEKNLLYGKNMFSIINSLLMSIIRLIAIAYSQ